MSLNTAALFVISALRIKTDANAQVTILETIVNITLLRCSRLILNKSKTECGGLKVGRICLRN